MAELQAMVYRLPMRPLRFRGLVEREGMLLRGPAGWAEWSPFPEYGDEEAAHWLRAAVEAATLGVPQPVRDRVPVNAIVPAVDAALAAQRARESGCTTVKVKVADDGSRSLADDVARVDAVRDALGPAARIRVDANGAWSVAEAERAVEQLAPLGLEYVEQPCATVEELAELRRRIDGAVLVAADESIRRAGDPHRVRDLGAADVAVLKVQPLGGVRRCLALAGELGMPVVVSSAIESSVGLRMGVALAAALPELPYACGLETGALLMGDVAVNPVRPHDGFIAVEDLLVDGAALERHRAPHEATAWWQQRLRRVSAHLADWPGMEPM